MKNKEKLNVGEKKGLPSQEHWEKDVADSVFERGYGNDPNGAFLPRPGKDRARPHVKVNECDH